MLFSSTLSVRASTVSNIDDLLDSLVVQTNGNIEPYRSDKFGQSKVTNGRNNANIFWGYYDFNFPFVVGTGSLNPNEYYYVELDISNFKQYWNFKCRYYPGTGNQLINVTDSPIYGYSANNAQYIRFSVLGLKATDYNGKVVSETFSSTGGSYKYCGYFRGVDLINADSNSNYTIAVPLHLDFSLNIEQQSNYNTLPYYGLPLADNGTTVEFAPVYNCKIYSLKGAYKYTIGGSTVTDNGTQQELNELNETQDSIKDTTEDTNETTHSIFDSISDFFGSFFSNLIGVFVPSSSFFTGWFNDMNTLLSQKLGILYYPFDLIIRFLNSMLSAFDTQTLHCYITFPEMKFRNVYTNETYVLLQEQTIDLYNYNYGSTGIGNFSSSPNSSLIGTNAFTSVLVLIRTVNGMIIVFSLISLLRQKLNLIMRGDNNDN